MTHYSLKHSRVVPPNDRGSIIVREARSAADAVMQQAEFMRWEYQQAMTTRLRIYQRMRGRADGIPDVPLVGPAAKE